MEYHTNRILMLESGERRCREDLSLIEESLSWVYVSINMKNKEEGLKVGLRL